MIRTPIADLRAHVGETITIAGWAKALRLQRAMQFVVVRDHTGAVQVTHRRDGTALESALDSLTAESAVRITGRGLFVHSAPWALRSLGLENVSHGCISLSPEDAEWYYNTVHVGDPVIVQDSPPQRQGPPLLWEAPPS